MNNDPSLYLALIHHPVLNKRGEIITTSVTNMDLHDIARSCRTYGIKKYFIVTPIELQKELVDKILSYWQELEAIEFNKDRHSALSLIQVVPSFDDAIKEIEILENGNTPLVTATSACPNTKTSTPEAYMKTLSEENRPGLILFGTGHGLSSQITEKCDFMLMPIVGKAKDHYNHLSVRSAVAIYCDRLYREKDK